MWGFSSKRALNINLSDCNFNRVRLKKSWTSLSSLFLQTRGSARTKGKKPSQGLKSKPKLVQRLPSKICNIMGERCKKKPKVWSFASSPPPPTPIPPPDMVFSRKRNSPSVFTPEISLSALKTNFTLPVPSQNLDVLAANVNPFC